MARNKKVEILSNDKEVLHPMTDGDCVIFEDGQTLTQKLSEDDSVKYTPEIVNSSPMFKVGEGNTVDYSDNVLDGAYERATLQGQTYVNYIQESSADEVTLPTPFTEYERTQHNTLTSDEEGVLGINLVGQSYVNALQHDSEEEFVVLGESLEFQEKKVEYTNEGQIKSAMLKGQTLVNLAKARFGTSGSNVNLTRTEVENGMTYTVPNQATGYITIRTDAHELLKPSTTYTILFEIVENTIQGYNGVTVSGTFDSYFSRGERQLYHNSAFDLSPGKKRLVVTTHNDISTYDGFGFGFPGFPHSGKEDAGVFTIKNVMVIEGDHTLEDIPYFEGMQSVTVSTRLENLCSRYNSSGAKNGKTFTVGTWENRGLTLSTTDNIAKYNFKPNTKYLVQFKVTNLNLDGLSSISVAFSDGEVSTGNSLFGDNAVVEVKSNGIYRGILTTSNVISTSNFVIKGLKNQWEESDSSLRSMTISEIMYVEYQNGMENWDLPYFEDYQVMKPVQVESVNKNIYDKEKSKLQSHTSVTFEGEAVSFYQGTQRFYLIPSVPFKENTQYTLSYTILQGMGYILFTYTDNTWSRVQGEGTSNSGKTVKRIESEWADETRSIISNIQLEESDTATEYVPHQSKTIYSWDEVILRKVGDVEDTLDLTTGEWVQRIGEIVLDGSESWLLNDQLPSRNGHYVFRYCPSDAKLSPEFMDANSDKFSPTKNINMIHEMNGEYVTFHGWAFGINICINGDKLVEKNFNGFKQWLSQNPTTVQYELATPIVHKVNLSRPNLQVYDDITHVHTKCLDGTLIPNIYLPSDISYPAILEPGKKYNVCVNQTKVSADNPLKVNVGGTEITMTDSRMTLTTPATLANSNVSFTGKGNKIKESMLIKNSSLLTRDLPHFNGIGSVQLGKTIENLCDSTDSMYGGCAATKTVYNDHVSVTVTKTGSLVICSNLIRPLENGKKYFVYAPNTFPAANACHVGFYNYYNNTYNFGHQVKSVKTGKCIIEIDQKDKLYTMITLGYHSTLPIGTYTINKPIICEYEPGMENWDWESIGYFTGMKNIGNEFMRVQNKNLFITNNATYGAVYYNVDNDYFIRNGTKARVTMKELIKVNKNSTLTLSCNNGFNCVIQEYISPIQRTFDNDSGWKNNHTLVLNEKTNYVNIYFRKSDDADFTDTEMEELKNSIQLEESSTATTYTAHKHNGLYITKDQPIELTWEQGQVLIDTYGSTYTSTINNSLTTRVRNKGLLNLKPNTTYRISSGDRTNFKYHIACFDNWDCSVKEITNIGSGWVSSMDTIFTTTKDMHKISINVAKVGDGTITPSEINQVRLEEVTDVVLRGIGNVYDELDITRGIYTQRISEMVLDGTHTYYKKLDTDKGTVYYVTTKDSIKTKDSGNFNFISNILNYAALIPVNNGILTSTVDNFKGVLDGWASALYFSIPTKDTDTNIDVSSQKAKQYLKENPITVQYVLETPIIHKVHIGNKNEANTEVAKPNDVFTLPTLYTEQTHIDLTNNGIIPKVQSRDYIAYPVSPMIGRTYTLQHNLVGGVSNLTVDLLGRTQSVSYQNHKSLVYTPESLVSNIKHKELRISGKGKISKVMYIDGGYMDRDIPYIEGMENAVNPIVKNVGKNLITNKIVASYSDVVIFEICKLKPNKQYIISSNYNFTQGLVTLEGNNKQFIIQNWAQNKKVFKAPTDIYNYNTIKFWKAGLSYDKTSMYFHMQELEDEVQSISYEPYKENICYVDCGEIRLTPDMFEQGSVGAASVGSHYNSDKADSGYRIRTKELIKLEMGEQYVFLGNNDKYKYSARFYDMDGNKISHSTTYDLSWKGNTPFTILNDAPMCAFFVKKANDSVITVDDTEAFNLQLVKVSEIKQLRSLPHGVHDEIDLENGKYIQRVGEITFNGTESWLPGYASWQNKYTYYNNGFVDIKPAKSTDGNSNAYYDALRCPQLHRSYMSRLASAAIDGVCSYYYSGYQRIFISKQDCATVDELQLWLKENPITVQYELPEPIVKDIVIHNYPHSYEDGHVIIENGDLNTPIPAQLTYRAVTNRSGQIQQHTEQVEKQEREINELETLILANIHLSQTR